MGLLLYLSATKKLYSYSTKWDEEKMFYQQPAPQ